MQNTAEFVTLKKIAQIHVYQRGISCERDDNSVFVFVFQNLSMAWEYVLLTNKDIYFVQTEEKPS